MRKIKEVLRVRFEQGLGQRQIARSCGLSTVRDYWNGQQQRGSAGLCPKASVKRNWKASCLETNPRACARQRNHDHNRIGKGFTSRLRQHRHLTPAVGMAGISPDSSRGLSLQLVCERYWEATRWPRWNISTVVGVERTSTACCTSVYQGSSVLRVVRPVRGSCFRQFSASMS
ncbi:MAG TPA: hypothetical protein VMU05_18360 [Dongiaceae bacterium]|nr:hypothetical protein [Dongiaceae bacterium]